MGENQRNRRQFPPSKIFSPVDVMRSVCADRNRRSSGMKTLHEICENAGVTFEGLAKDIGVPVEELNRLESNPTGLDWTFGDENEDLIARIARALQSKGVPWQGVAVWFAARGFLHPQVRRQVYELVRAFPLNHDIGLLWFLATPYRKQSALAAIRQELFLRGWACSKTPRLSEH